MLFSANMLLAAAPKIEQELSVHVAVGAFSVEGLEMTVDAEFRDDPVTAAQMKTLEKNRANRIAGVLFSAFLGGRFFGEGAHGKEWKEKLGRK